MSGVIPHGVSWSTFIPYSSKFQRFLHPSSPLVIWKFLFPTSGGDFIVRIVVLRVRTRVDHLSLLASNTDSLVFPRNAVVKGVMTHADIVYLQQL